MNAAFKIEAISVDGPHAYVRTRIVSPRNFAVSDGSLLGRVRLRSYLHEPNPGSFDFRIENPLDAARLKLGDIVDLET